MLWKVARSKILLGKNKALRYIFHEDNIKADKVAKTIQVLQKELKLEKSARKAS